MILEEEGLPQVWRRHEVLASTVWAAFATWGETTNAIGINMTEPADRGRSVTAARIGNGGAGALRKWLENEAGVTLGIGLGMALPSEPAYADFLRVAHMGHINAHMVLGVLASMEAGMQALGIPHGPGGVEAAAAAFARGLAA
jgi:alanine-glyoxylate transaminase/serine-glyoxylate transaminase/serine-pyruvate transaminase